MSHNNTRNTIHNKVGCNANDEEMERLLNSSNVPQHTVENNLMTAINIENDLSPGTSQQHLERQQKLQNIGRDGEATRINMESSTVNPQTVNFGENQNENRQRTPNLITIFREARHQLTRSQSVRDHQPSINVDDISANNPPHTRTWRENLFEVFSSPVSPHAHTNFLRAFFSSSSNFRYDSLHNNVLFPNDQNHLTNNQSFIRNEGEVQPPISPRNNSFENQSISALRLSRQSSRLLDDSTLNENYTPEHQSPATNISVENSSSINNIRRQSVTNIATNSGRQPQRQTSVSSTTTAPAVDMLDESDANDVSEIIFKFGTHFIRYLPFIFIIFVKFVHDHLLGILDIILLHGVVYQMNKSIKQQVAKLNQKSFAVLVRDSALVVCVVTYRFILSTSTPDPFGLFINPPDATITLDLTSTKKIGPTNEVSADRLMVLAANELPTPSTENFLDSTISVTKTISLGTLLYYVAVNDLILKLMTQFVKIIVTMFPTKIIRHKSRARLYAAIEGTSQFYRALVPIRQWLRYLFESYTGLEVISGILFSSFYMGAKLFELYARGKPFKSALVNFIRNMDYDRKPTRDELGAAGAVCPICHDPYSSPVILECNHIFCDECVNTWFKREQTCPMCRAKVCEDPTWQDGATTYFYQLC